MPSASKLSTYLFYMWRQYDVIVTFITVMTCDSVCCMCGEACSSRWLMTQLTNGQHACVLVFVPMRWTFWTYLVTVNSFYLYFMNFMFDITLDAVGNTLRVHYKSMKCDVSFSRGSVSRLLRWGEHVFHVCVKMFSLLTAVQKYILKNQTRSSRVMTTNALPRFYEPQCTRIETHLPVFTGREHG